MGFKQALVLAPVSFFLGVLFICFNVDQRILWGDLSPQTISDGFQFYTTFFNAPPAIKTLLHTLMGAALLGFIVKLHKWDDSAMFFDGTSLAAYVFALAIYIGVTGPGLRTIVLPASEVESPDIQVESLRVLSAGNIIMVGCLLFVLALQAGQEWASRAEQTARDNIEKARVRQAAAAVEEKKEQ